MIPRNTTAAATSSRFSSFSTSIPSLQDANIFLSNLQVLGFDEKIHCKDTRIKINKDVFLAGADNTKAFEIISYFLFYQLDKQKTKSLFKYCWPTNNSKERASNYKHIALDWLQQLKNESTLFQSVQLRMSNLKDCRGEIMNEIFMAFSTLVLEKVAIRKKIDITLFKKATKATMQHELQKLAQQLTKKEQEFKQAKASWSQQAQLISSELSREEPVTTTATPEQQQTPVFNNEMVTRAISHTCIRVEKTVEKLRDKEFEQVERQLKEKWEQQQEAERIERERREQEAAEQRQKEREIQRQERLQKEAEERKERERLQREADERREILQREDEERRERELQERSQKEAEERRERERLQRIEAERFERKRQMQLEYQQQIQRQAEEQLEKEHQAEIQSIEAERIERERQVGIARQLALEREAEQQRERERLQARQQLERWQENEQLKHKEIISNSISAQRQQYTQTVRKVDLTLRKPYRSSETYKKLLDIMNRPASKIDSLYFLPPFPNPDSTKHQMNTASHQASVESAPAVSPIRISSSPHKYRGSGRHHSPKSTSATSLTADPGLITDENSHTTSFNLYTPPTSRTTTKGIKRRVSTAELEATSSPNKRQQQFYSPDRPMPRRALNYTSPAASTRLSLTPHRDISAYSPLTMHHDSKEQNGLTGTTTATVSPYRSNTSTFLSPARPISSGYLYKDISTATTVYPTNQHIPPSPMTAAALSNISRGATTSPYKPVATLLSPTRPTISSFLMSSPSRQRVLSAIRSSSLNTHSTTLHEATRVTTPTTTTTAIRYSPARNARGQTIFSDQYEEEEDEDEYYLNGLQSVQPLDLELPPSTLYNTTPTRSTTAANQFYNNAMATPAFDLYKYTPVTRR